MRLACTAPMTIEHKALVDSEVAGYRIPKGTIVSVIYNATALFLQNSNFQNLAKYQRCELKQ